MSTDSRFGHRNIFNITIVAETIKKEIERRRIQLWIHRFLYYEYDTSIVSDFEYDLKEYEYKILREFYSWFPPLGACPLDSVGTATDERTRNKVYELIKTILKPEKPQQELIEEVAVRDNGQIMLFGGAYCIN